MKNKNKTKTTKGTNEMKKGNNDNRKTPLMAEFKSRKTKVDSRSREYVVYAEGLGFFAGDDGKKFFAESVDSAVKYTMCEAEKSKKHLADFLPGVLVLKVCR